MKSKSTIKDSSGFFNAEIPIYELVTIGNKIIIRYNYDLDMNGGGAGSFDYIEFEILINNNTK